jgi:hypothetical protein
MSKIIRLVKTWDPIFTSPDISQTIDLVYIF